MSYKSHQSYKKQSLEVVEVSFNIYINITVKLRHYQDAGKCNNSRFLLLELINLAKVAFHNGVLLNCK